VDGSVPFGAVDGARAVGTDIIHLHPSVSPEALGARATGISPLCGPVSELDQGSLSTGLRGDQPGIFLKALTLARNLGHQASP